MFYSPASSVVFKIRTGVLALVLILTLFINIETAFSQEAALTPEEKALKEKYGDKFLEELSRTGVTAEKYIYATKLTTLALQKYKDQELADARFLLEKAWSIIKSPKILFYLARTYFNLGDYVKARDLLLEFPRAAEKWKLTSIQKVFFTDVKTLKAECEKHLVELQIICTPEKTQVFVNTHFIGLSPLKSSVMVLPGVVRISLVKKDYKRRDIQLDIPKGGVKVIKNFKLLTVEEDLRQTKLFMETEQKRRLALIKLEKERQEKLVDQTERWQRINKWSRVAFITGAVFLGSAVITGSVSYIFNRKINNTGPTTTWDDSTMDYKISKYSGNTAIGLASGGVLLFSAGWYLYSLSNGKLKSLEREKKGGITIIPLLSGDTKGLSLSFDF